MKEHLKSLIPRRDLFRAAIAGVAAAATSALMPEPAAAELLTSKKSAGRATTRIPPRFKTSTASIAIRPDRGGVRADQKVGTSSKPRKRR